ncbi:hypothetical protein BV898_09247 [Hypsibius exemplaris]|uniref:Uncharacterized protein n=1 Tax=Hypsibius exemplaris TaxID=2072580 RepID=A0A1W0WMY7_HYPEX|nr:hypothetical protein BV898_09247 [Hypsibius exemplaris]
MRKDNCIGLPVTVLVLVVLAGTDHAKGARLLKTTLYFNGSLLDESMNDVFVSAEADMEFPDFLTDTTPSPQPPTAVSVNCTTCPVPEEFIQPLNRTFQIGCVELLPNVSYVPPEFFVGNITVDRAGNWTFVQLGMSNFDVDLTTGKVTVGGYVLGDGFEGTIPVSIHDVSSECNQGTEVGFNVRIQCYPDRLTTLSPATFTNRTAKMSPTLTTSTTTMSYAGSMEYHFPAGVDLG